MLAGQQRATARPRAVLFDLDDTLISAYANQERAWAAVTQEFAAELLPLAPVDVAAAVVEFATAFWADPDRHREWRMRLVDARRAVVEGGFARLAARGVAVPSTATAIRLADRFSAYRVEQMSLMAGAWEVLDSLRSRGFMLGLITNGASADQRAKLVRFDLERRFDHIQIEQELGIGKPEEVAYRHAAKMLGVTPGACWIVGDNIEWEVRAPQRLGMGTVWYAAAGSGLPAHSDVRPDHTIRSLSELLDRLPREFESVSNER